MDIDTLTAAEIIEEAAIALLKGADPAAVARDLIEDAMALRAKYQEIEHRNPN